eukprot:1123206_1
MTEDQYCFGQKCSIYKAKHPGSASLLQLAANVPAECQRLLFLSYHVTKDFNKIRAIANKYGYTDVDNIKRRPLYEEIHEVFTKICRKYWIHGCIYQLYCVLITVLSGYLFSIHFFFEFNKFIQFTLHGAVSHQLRLRGVSYSASSSQFAQECHDNRD